MKPIQTFINREADSLLNMINAFRDLLPHHAHDASVHSGEEGRAIEIIVREYLREKLPESLGVGCGFLIDPVQRWQSKQIDVIVYDQKNFSPIFRYGDALVVHVGAAVGVLSIKKRLYKADIVPELSTLTEIGSICGRYPFCKPFLALLAFEIAEEFKKAVISVKNCLRESYSPRFDQKDRAIPFSWGELVDAIMVPGSLMVRLKTLDEPTEALASGQDYIWTGANEGYNHVYFQTLLRGIKRRYFDGRRGPKLGGVELEYFPSAKMSHLISVTTTEKPRRPNVWKNVKLGPSVRKIRADILSLLRNRQAQLNVPLKMKRSRSAPLPITKE